ncbi:MAG: bifunctional sugar-1-phosphate nucleotidylyltransferase/acetyltransferase [Candidatus Woesearchaeota archaeon]
MKAIILCAGKSTRTYPLTINTPKPLLKILNKTILEHNLEQLTELVDEIIIIVGYLKEQIISKIGNKYKNIKIKYIEQKKQLGTGHAVLLCENLKGKFIVMCGDDLYSKKDIKKLLNHDNAALAKKVQNPSEFGIFLTKNNKMTNIIEKPKNNIGNLANTGCYILNDNIFKLLKNTKKSKRGEIEIIDVFKKIKDFKIIEVTDFWIPIAYPWNYLEANVEFLKKIKKVIKGKIEKNNTIKGDIFLGKGSIIKSNSYIEGPVYIGENCTIGPNAYIRKDTIIMDNCNIRSEVYDSVIMNSTTAKHTSYIGHSVICENVNIGAGTITSDYRHDKKEHITIINNKKIETKRKKLGAFIGQNVKTGIGTLIYPGRKIWPNLGTLPGEILIKDKIK